MDDCQDECENTESKILREMKQNILSVTNNYALDFAALLTLTTATFSIKQKFVNLAIYLLKVLTKQIHSAVR